MPLIRLLGVAVLAVTLHTSVAAAICAHTITCHGDGSNDAAPLVAACCGASSCTLDGQVSLSGPLCVLDFGGRSVTLSGRLVVGSGTLAVSAASLTLTTGTIDATGPGDRNGGAVAVRTIGHATTAFAMTTAQARIDVSGGGTIGAGTFTLDADGPVTLTAGSIVADGTGDFSNGGSIDVATSTGAMQLGARITVRSGLIGSGGSVTVRAPDALTVRNTINAQGGDQYAAIDLRAGGPIVIDSGGPLIASALPLSYDSGGGDGGSIVVAGRSILVKDQLLAAADSDGTGGIIEMEAFAGPITLTGSGIVIDGDEGDLSIVTHTPAPDGTVTIGATISAQALGSVDGSTGGGSVRVQASGAISTSKRIAVSGLGGQTGEVELTALRNVVVNSQIIGNDPGGGGVITIVAGADVSLFGDLQLRGTGDDFATGGEISVAAGNDLKVDVGELDVTGVTGDGGSVNLNAVRHLTFARTARIVADSEDAAQGIGGTVALRAGTRCGPGLCLSAGDRRSDAAGDLTIDGRITRGSSTSTGAATIDLDGCLVHIGATGLVDALKGTNTVTARGPFTITTGGALRTTSPGANLLVSAGGGAPPASSVSPPLQVTTRSTCTAPGTPVGCLFPCTACGNGTVTGPFETCDAGTGARCGADGGTFCAACRTTACADDGNPCTVEGCDEAGGCWRGNRPTGASCGTRDGCPLFCESGAAEIAAECHPLTPAACDDNNPCTIDCFDPASGCLHVPQTATGVAGCDDFNICTGQERCVAGACVAGTPPTCPAGKVCDPNRPATDPCVAKPCALAADCNDGNSCTRDVCTAAHVCANPGDATLSCSDGNACNGRETCTAAGACIRGAPPVCDDGDVCTDDSCDAHDGCRHDAVPGCCNDAGDCGGTPACAATCVDHVCVQPPNCCVIDADCNDGNPCTDDGRCTANRCTAGTPVTGDRPGCGDICQPGTCAGGTCTLGAAVTCPDDGDTCTREYCKIEAGGCVREGCDDGNPCTEDTCADVGTGEKSCRSVAIDGCKPCTVDTDCADQGRCGGGACSSGRCERVPKCDDGDLATDDRCILDADGQAVCTFPCKMDSACDDRDACSVDACVDPGGAAPTCRHTLAGWDALDCRLGTLVSAVAGAPPADLAKTLRKRLARDLTQLRKRLQTAQRQTKPKKAAKLLAAAAKTGAAVDRAIATARRKAKPQIVAALADQLQGGLRTVLGGLDALRTTP